MAEKIEEGKEEEKMAGGLKSVNPAAGEEENAKWFLGGIGGLSVGGGCAVLVDNPL